MQWLYSNMVLWAHQAQFPRPTVSGFFMDIGALGAQVPESCVRGAAWG